MWLSLHHDHQGHDPWLTQERRHSWGPSLLGVSPPGDTAVVILWENSWNIYGKLWKMMEKTYGKKNTNYGKTHGKPRIWWLIIIWPSFHGFILGGIHQFQRHTHNHPYVIVRNPIPLIKLNITWSNYEPPTQSDGIEGDLPWFTDISDFFGLLRECLISRGWDYNTTQPGEDGRCEGSSNAPVSGLLIGFKSTNCPYKFWF